jgi:hypothetical protein
MPDATASTPPTDAKLRLRWLAVGVFVGGLLLAAGQIAADGRPDVRHPATLSTAWVSFALWAGAAGLMIPATAGEWRPGATRFRLAKLSWALGAAMFVVHVLVAFHFAHRWHHDNAFTHVADTAGFGPGIFVSYFFTLLWAADAVWWVVSPARYAARSQWVGWTGHGFMAFVTFNGTVVYVSGWIRWVAAGVFVALGVALLVRWWRSTRVSG